MMKIFQETVIPAPGESIRVEEVVGPVARCLYHLHPECELTFVQGSFGCRYIGSDVSTFQPGDFVLIRGNVPHYYYTDAADSQGEDWCRLLVIQFSPQLLPMGLPEFGQVRELLETRAHGIVFKGVPEEAVLEVRNTSDLPRLLAFLNLLERLTHTPHELIGTEASPEEHFKSDSRLAEAVKAIHRGLERNETISLPQIARLSSMTPVAFSHYFHQTTGMRFIDYLTQLKLSRAKNLLLHTTNQIWDVAQKSGFANLSNFNRLFQKHLHVSPRHFRQKWRL